MKNEIYVIYKENNCIRFESYDIPGVAHSKINYKTVIKSEKDLENWIESLKRIENSPNNIRIEELNLDWTKDQGYNELYEYLNLLFKNKDFEK